MDDNGTQTTGVDDAEPRRPPRGMGLSAKLLVLTILFVMLSEVLIFVPSMANFRVTWLNDKLNQARLAANVFEAAPDAMVPPDLQREILDSIGALTLALKRGDRRQFLAISDMPAKVDKDIDLRAPGAVGTRRRAPRPSAPRSSTSSPPSPQAAYSRRRRASWKRSSTSPESASAARASPPGSARTSSRAGARQPTTHRSGSSVSGAPGTIASG